jgi:hypothetical protein
MEHATADHNDIREAICEAQLAAAGSAAWWRAVDAARKASADHFAGQERAAMISLRHSLPLAARQCLGAQWNQYITARVMNRRSLGADERPLNLALLSTACRTVPRPHLADDGYCGDLGPERDDRRVDQVNDHFPEGGDDKTPQAERREWPPAGKPEEPDQQPPSPAPGS